MNGKLYKIGESFFFKDETGKTLAKDTLREDLELRLSLQNCEAIARGYNLEDLAIEEFPYDFDCPLFETLGITEKVQKSILIGMLQGTLMKGFKKAMEIIGDNNFDEGDILQAINMAVRVKDFCEKLNTEGDELSIARDNRFYTENEIIESLQQTEWDVEIEQMLQVRHGVEWHDLPNQKFGNDPEGIYQYVPKLDSNGCIILKKIR